MNRSLKIKRSAAMMFVVIITVFVPFAEAWAGQFPTASGGTGSSTDPYQIKTIEDLNKLAVDVNSGTTYEGVYFKVMNDIDFNDDATLKPTTAWNLTEATEENNFTRIGYWTGSASTNRPFLGHFDGDGKTIRGIRIYKIVDTQADNYQGLFGWIGSGAEVKNVILDDARIVCGHYSSGIVGQNSGGTIEGCQVTAKVAVFGIHSSGTTHCLGGIVGRNDTEDSTVKNCTSSVTIGVIGETKCRHCGGIVGYNNGSVTDNFVIGATIPGAALNNHGAIAGSNHNNGTLQRNYYNACTIAGVKNATSKGCSNADVAANDGALPVFSLTLATGITTTTEPFLTYDGIGYYKAGTEITLSGGQTAPPVGKIYEGYIVNDSPIDVTSFTMPAQNTTVVFNTVSVYSLTLATGITTMATPATTVDGIPYFRVGTEIILSGQPANVGEGYVCPYIVDGTAIIGNTFIMPTKNINVAFGEKTDDWLYVYDGNSEATAYQIRNTDHLDMLAQRVNSGTTFEGKYFKLMNDIGYAPTTAWDDETSTENNYTAIGNKDNPFKGYFNGNDKTISGIRIYYPLFEYQGLFGAIDGEAEVSGVTLSDTRITAASNTGGIVGYNNGIVENCQVALDIALCAGQSVVQNIGGIVGWNRFIIEKCTSAVTITMASGISGCSYFGGIVGDNERFLSNCRVIGASVVAVSNAGAIVGGGSGSLDMNTYHSCLVGSNAFNIGTNSGDQIGAVVYLAALDPTALYLDDRKDNTALIAAYADPASHTANDGNAPDIGFLTVTLVREFKKDVCSIVCLPFDCTPASDIGSFYAFDGMENTGNGYVPTMTTDNQVTMLTANTPYLFMPAATGEVTLSGTKSSEIPFTAGETVSGDWKLIGSYARKTWTAAETGAHVLDANGALTAVTAGTTIRPTYGYFVSATVVASGTCGTNLTWELTKNGQKEGGEPTYKLTITGSGAMADYDNSAPWQSYSNAITEVSLPNGLTRVGETAFYNCIALTTVIIPASVTTIGTSAFNWCESMSTVNFAEGSQLTGIGIDAFSRTALTAVTIPASVTMICVGAFSSCSSLSTVNFAEGSQLTTIGGSAFYGTALTAVTIPASVTTIDDGAFFACNSLSTVNFAEGSQLTTIGIAAFSETALTTVTIPASVMTIGNSAFYGIALTTVTIPASVTTIGDYAFQYCGSLSTVNVMSATPPSLGDDAFDFDCACTFNVRSAAYLTADGWKDVANKTGDYNGKDFTMNVISALTLDEGITATPAAVVSYEGADYYAEGTAITLSYNNPGYVLNEFSSSDVTISSAGSFTMPAKDVTVSATILRDMSGLFADGNAWTGYVAQEDLALPDGLTAYVVTALGETTATATAIDYIPQGEPVLLCRSDKTVNSYAASAYTGSGSAPAGNLFRAATATSQPTAYHDYVLYKDAFVLTSGGTLATGKVYLSVPSANASRAVARAIVTDDGETTGMEDVRWQTEEGSGDWYSIDGRKLNGKPAKKGLYIHKGKKVVR